MTILEAGSVSVTLKRGDIIEAMLDEGLAPDIAKRVFERLTQRDREMKVMQYQSQADCMKAQMDVIACMKFDDGIRHDPRCDGSCQERRAEGEK